MKVGDLVINVYDKDDGIGVIINGAGDGCWNIYWPMWDTNCVMHDSRLEVV